MEQRKRYFIADLLGSGKDSAIHQRDLCSAVGCKPSALKSQIKKERLDGSLICSCDNGYFLGETEEEIAEFVKHEESQAKSRLAITAPFRRRLKEMAEADQILIGEYAEVLDGEEADV